jgi:ABC-2 type transport system permease protein
MGPVLAIAWKDIRLLLRDKAGLFFTFFLPLLYAVFFGVINAGFSAPGSGIDIVVVDEDGTPASRDFVDRLRHGDDFDVTEATADRPVLRGDAEDLVRRGRKTAFVVLPKGFGEASERMFWGDPMTIIVGVDPSRKAEAGMVTGLLTARAYERMQRLFTDPESMKDMSRRALDAVVADPEIPAATRNTLEPFLRSLDRFSQELPAVQGNSAAGGVGAKFEPVRILLADVARERTNAYALTFPQGILWGLMGASAGFGISLVVERTRGTLMRLRVSPIESWHILAGKGLACFLTIVFLSVLLLAIACAVFHVRPTSLPLLAMAVGCSGVAFVGVMMLLSMFKTEAAAGGGGWAILLVCAMFGGAMIPLRFMPSFLGPVSRLSPVMWAIYALEGALWRDLTFTQMLLPCGILLGVGVGGFSLGAWSFRRLTAT